MLGEMSLARLVEMGVDVYVPRVRSVAAPTVAPSPRAGPRITLLARANSAAEKALVADVGRALRFAGRDSVLESNAGAALGDAAGWVAFGDPLARAAGAALPVERRNTVPSVATSDIGALPGDAAAKRALWAELKRLARALGRG